VLRRVGGYNLDSVTGGGHNMAHLLVGSEGTLAYSKRLHLNLSPLPKHKTLGICHFPTFYRSMEAPQHIVKLDPVAVELVDRTMIGLARANPAFRPIVERCVTGDPDAILLVEFAGDDRNVMDYLTTEVLAGQAVETRAFMLATSVLDRLCAPLCDEILDSTASAAMLRSIEGSNSFLIALDHRREWYRYHHLFRELLRNELLSSDPAAAATINRRAAIWLGDRGFVSEAISHLVAAGEVEEAGELIASSWLRLASSGEHETVRVWLELLPFALREGDSRLCVASALVAIATGRLDEVGRWIDQAARAPAGGPFHDGFSSGAAAADCLRTIHNWLLGDLGASRAAGEAAILGAAFGATERGA
jgi:hypothetical protein